MEVYSNILPIGSQLRGGDYTIERHLGSGGFGNTYVVRNRLDKQLALKEFFLKDVCVRNDGDVTASTPSGKANFETYRKKFEKEARRLSQIDNQHVVKVHDLFYENGTTYYTMDFIDGQSLKERMDKMGRPFTEKEMMQILSQILDALKSVHDAGIWHLDLKPANIMVDKSDKVKLIDFGASKQLNAQKGGATTSTAICYTNGYAPREQMEQNYDKFGPWTDIYALGATLYNLLTNRRPPLPSDIDDDETENKRKALPFPATTSASMRQLVLRMLNTNRSRRPQNIDEIGLLMSTNSSEEETDKIKNGGEKKRKKIIIPTKNQGDEETIIGEDAKNVIVDDTETDSSFEEDDDEEKGGRARLWILLLLLLAALGGGGYYLYSTGQLDNLLEKVGIDVKDNKNSKADSDIDFESRISELVDVFNDIESAEDVVDWMKEAAQLNIDFYESNPSAEEVEAYEEAGNKAVNIMESCDDKDEFFRMALKQLEEDEEFKKLSEEADKAEKKWKDKHKDSSP